MASAYLPFSIVPSLFSRRLALNACVSRQFPQKRRYLIISRSAIFFLPIFIDPRAVAFSWRKNAPVNSRNQRIAKTQLSESQISPSEISRSVDILDKKQKCLPLSTSPM
jgi:hypothetical protein